MCVPHSSTMRHSSFPLLYDLYFLQHITITYEGKCFPRSSDLENASNNFFFFLYRYEQWTKCPWPHLREVKDPVPKDIPSNVYSLISTTKWLYDQMDIKPNVCKTKVHSTNWMPMQQNVQTMKFSCFISSSFQVGNLCHWPSFPVDRVLLLTHFFGYQRLLAGGVYQLTQFIYWQTFPRWLFSILPILMEYQNIVIFSILSIFPI